MYPWLADLGLSEGQTQRFWGRLIMAASDGLKATPEQAYELACTLRDQDIQTGDERRAEAKRKDARDGIVYYVRFGDRVKIGTTVNLRQRLMSLPHDEVLVTEPGSYALERKRHKEFASSRITPRGEWFAYDDALKEHIRCLLLPQTQTSSPTS